MTYPAIQKARSELWYDGGGTSDVELTTHIPKPIRERYNLDAVEKFLSELSDIDFDDFVICDDAELEDNLKTMPPIASEVHLFLNCLFNNINNDTDEDWG